MAQDFAPVYFNSERLVFIFKHNDLYYRLKSLPKDPMKSVQRAVTKDIGDQKWAVISGKRLKFYPAFADMSEWVQKNYGVYA